MSIPIHVLILEDRSEDAELMLRELRQANFAPEWKRVETEAGYVSRLENGGWDVILADYSLPQYDALRALRELQERELDTPFLVVTGSVSEEVAVECMKKGADDYLLKDRLTRLGQAVTQALEARELRRERRHAVAAMRSYTERLRTLRAIDGAILAAWDIDEIAAATLRHIQQIVPYTIGNVALIDPQSLEARIITVRSTRNTVFKEGTTIPFAGSTEIEQLQQGQVILEQDLRTRTEKLPAGDRLREDGVCSFIVAPLIAQGELIGLLGVNAHRPHAFSNEDIDVVHEVGSQLAIGIRQTLLYQSVQRHAEDLEAQVDARTRDLQRRTTQLHVAAEVARDATTMQDLDSLLDRAVNLIKERFGFYHAGLFLLDEEGEYAILKAAASSAGEEMLRRRHRLQVGQEGIVGYATETGEPRIALDVGADAAHFDNPFLPETRSEMAIPLQVNGAIIGALDVQSTQEAAFDQPDIEIMQVLADQLAVAIEKTHLFEQTQATLETQLQTVVSNISVILFAVDQDGVFILSEGRGLNELGLRPGQAVGESVFEMFGDVPQIPHNIRRALQGETFRDVVKIDGLFLDTSYTPMHDEQGQIIGVIGVSIDVTERKKAEQQIRRLARFPSENPFPVLRISAEGSIRYANRASDSLLQAWNAAENERIPEKWRDIVRTALKTGTNSIVEVNYSDQIVSLTFAPVPEGDYVNVYSFDITKQREAEERLHRQQRLAAIGQLAGGIAHDFNNFLTTITLYSQILLRHPDLTHALAPNVETILEEAQRAAQLVQQILDFSRRSQMETQSLDLDRFVREKVKVLQRTLPENVRCTFDLDGGERLINADPTRIQQVLMNLVVNSQQAMPEGGKIEIAVTDLVVGESQPAPVDDMEAGKWVCLSVKDTGTGIPPDVAPHIFEPFFTTKAAGEGTGLGLAQVHGIVRQHGGYIDLETEIGKGTSFYLYFPRLEGRAREEERAQAPPLGHRETILLVEDNRRILRCGREILEHLNYHVLTAKNGRDAVDVFQSAAKVDLLVTDVIMPEVGGKETIRTLRKHQPDLKALVVTGYALTNEIEELREMGIADVLSKPFDINTLGLAVDAALHPER